MESLLQSKLISNNDVVAINKTMEQLNCGVIESIGRLGCCGEDSLYMALSRELRWELIENVSQCPLAPSIIDACQHFGLSIDWCLERNVYITVDDQSVCIYISKPDASFEMSVIKTLTHDKDVYFHLVTPAMAANISDDVNRERAVSELFGNSTSDIAALAEEAPVVNLVNSIVERAVQADSSDIHIEPGNLHMVVRFRVDGRMTEFMQQPMARFQAIASRIKLLSELDIAERRLPQDGRFTTRANNREFDVRVSTAPDVHGESIVLRLLPKKRDELKLEGLGFEQDHLQLIREWGALSNGIVLVTGPTGSGKSTTLYGLLADIKTGQEKIVTVEDPVEFQLDGITQVQARPDIGYTFAKALRTFLRQDPDVIMVGEIRDKETADIAVQSSLTGHLVLSTLHTNDACSVFPRLADIGVEPYLTAATIQGVQAQRLVRKLCELCSEPTDPPSFLKEGMQGNWRKPVGCSSCHGRGYKGRIGIYELVPVDLKMKELITQRAPVSQIREHSKNSGNRSLFDDGLLKAARGITTVDEVLRVCHTGEDQE
ncbi:type II/IV secretion system protein [Neptunicella marina]|uniref:Type II/IV secretion system protein n=1 Tax=Neptunicella marina TaxID=2125989 RepID=A0A8J6IQ09_9ALTE|nr:type II/IV secretion system protein [Neptunicella marina]